MSNAALHIMMAAVILEELKRQEKENYHDGPFVGNEKELHFVYVDGRVDLIAIARAVESAMLAAKR